MKIFIPRRPSKSTHESELDDDEEDLDDSHKNANFD